MPIASPRKVATETAIASAEQAQGRQFAAVLPPGEHAIGDQPEEQAGRESRHRHVGLGLLEIMNEREQRDRVDHLMQAPPAQAAEPAHHAVGRGRSQRGKSDPRNRADDQINAMRDFVEELFRHCSSGRRKTARDARRCSRTCRRRACVAHRSDCRSARCAETASPRASRRERPAPRNRRDESIR